MADGESPRGGFDGSRLLFVNEAAAVLNKLPGETAEGARPGMVDIPGMLAAYWGGEPPAAVHRLDVPVSGCLLLARTPAARAFLSEAFAGGRVEKHYWAILEAPPAAAGIPEAGELVHWLETDRRRNKSIAHNEEKPGRKRAVLRCRILGRGDRYLFAEVEPLTGRRHQIRAQFAALGLHVKGDLKYGARRSERGGGIRLHARSLAFPNPLDPGEIIRVTAPPPLPDNLWAAFEEAAGNPPAEDR